MNKKETLEVANQVFYNIFERENPYTIDEIEEKFAFDVKLPKQVKDSLTGEITWSEMENAKKFITQKNMDKYDETKGWVLKKRPINSLEDIINLWDKINYTTTERYYDSMNVSESDTIYNCTNVYRSTDFHKSKNIIACQRSGDSTNCIRVDDSGTCSNSYNVICSAKITNSIFIQDCNNLYECMFCSHIANMRYCISNMQFEQEEYFKIKKVIVDWILQ